MEWVIVLYVVLTALIILFGYTKLQAPAALLEGRVRIMLTIAAMWVVYRLVPCRVTLMLRVLVQMALLAWWYPDTYDIGQLFGNHDALFAEVDQMLFGCQPALLFAAALPGKVVSELMSLGYAAYYPLIILVCYYSFFRHYEQFERSCYVITAAFFTYYVIYDLLPVAGPTFYYQAIGTANAAQGSFPSVGNYFATHTECLPTPGYADGLFYNAVEGAKAMGERPTAAFPSSHVGIATICMMLLARMKATRLLICLAPVYVLLCLSTVYIQAHYAIDSIAGLLTGIFFYYIFMATFPQRPTRRRA